MVKVKIRLLTSLAGAEVLPAGIEIETTAQEATSLINSGYAELVDEIETATAPPRMEKAATVPKPRKTRKSKK